jgi:glycosyltransferase involved in cell wall biosynthesis
LTFLNSLEPGGVERVALRLHAAWSARGFDSQLVLGSDNGALGDEVELTAVHVLSPNPARSGILQHLRMIIRLPGMIRSMRPDILFCAGNTYSLVAVVLRLLLGRKCPPIIAKVSNDLARRDFSPLLRRVYHAWLRVQGRFIDHFVGMAPAMRREIADGMGVTPDRITIIDDPALSIIDLDRFAAARACGERRRRGRLFLAVGRLVPQKNFALLLAAFARIAGPDDRLQILGDGPERAKLERLAVALGIADAVDLPGHLNPLDQWFAKADALIVSSDYEGVPAVVIEALAAGLWVVSTDCSVNMGDLLDQGRLGKLVATRDLAGLAAAMAQIDGSEANVVMARAQARRFTVENAAAAYIETMVRCREARPAAY